MMNHVQDLMTTDCKCVTLQDNVYEIAVMMADNGIGFVPVVDVHNKSKLIGVVTDRDLVVRGYAEKRPGSAAVEKVMSSYPITIGPDKSVDEAAELMAEHQIRRLPVVEQDRLVGIISLGDLAIASDAQFEAGHALSEISEHGRNYLH